MGRGNSQPAAQPRTQQPTGYAGQGAGQQHARLGTLDGLDPHNFTAQPRLLVPPPATAAPAPEPTPTLGVNDPNMMRPKGGAGLAPVPYSR